MLDQPCRSTADRDEAEWLGAQITPALSREWMVADPQEWNAQSTALRDQVYPIEDSRSLGRRDIYENTPGWNCVWRRVACGSRLTSTSCPVDHALDAKVEH